jgi:hypothetical protein
MNQQLLQRDGCSEVSWATWRLPAQQQSSESLGAYIDQLVRRWRAAALAPEPPPLRLRRRSMLPALRRRASAPALAGGLRAAGLLPRAPQHASRALPAPSSRPLPPQHQQLQASLSVPIISKEHLSQGNRSFKIFSNDMCAAPWRRRRCCCCCCCWRSPGDAAAATGRARLQAAPAAAPPPWGLAALAHLPLPRPHRATHRPHLPAGCPSWCRRSTTSCCPTTCRRSRRRAARRCSRWRAAGEARACARSAPSRRRCAPRPSLPSCGPQLPDGERCAGSHIVAACR